MPKRHQQPNAALYPLSGNTGWSIGSNGLTPSGQNDLLKHLGRQLQMNYQGLMKEPTPDRFRQLLERLEQHRNGADEDEQQDSPTERSGKPC